MDITQQQLAQLAEQAWQVRAHARIVGDTKVGCAVLTSEGRTFTGCNVEHKFRCHDVHAEVNAITSMVASGFRHCVALVITAERDRFTPCGGCMDWIMEFGTAQTVVGFQGTPGGEILAYKAGDLMPHYPS
jgi:cytidine deaminase